MLAFLVGPLVELVVPRELLATMAPPDAVRSSTILASSHGIGTPEGPSQYHFLVMSGILKAPPSGSLFIMFSSTLASVKSCGEC